MFMFPFVLIRPWHNLPPPPWWSRACDLCGWSVRVFSREMVIMNDLEWRMLTYYVIYYEKFRNVMQRTEKGTLILVCVSGMAIYHWLWLVSARGQGILHSHLMHITVINSIYLLTPKHVCNWTSQLFYSTGNVLYYHIPPLPNVHARSTTWPC